MCDNLQLTFSYPAELQFKVLVLDLIMDNVDTTVRGREGERRGGGWWKILEMGIDLRITDLTFLLLLLQSPYKSALSSKERERERDWNIKFDQASIS